MKLELQYLLVIIIVFLVIYIFFPAKNCRNRHIMRRKNNPLRETPETIDSDPSNALYSKNIEFRPYDEKIIKQTEDPDKLFDEIDSLSLGAYYDVRKYNDPETIQGLSEDDLMMRMSRSKRIRPVQKNPDDGEDDPENYRGQLDNLDIYCVSGNTVRDTSSYDNMVHNTIVSSGDENEYYDYNLANSGKVPLGMDEKEANYSETKEDMCGGDYSEKDVYELIVSENKNSMKTIRGISA